MCVSVVSWVYIFLRSQVGQPEDGFMRASYTALEPYLFFTFLCAEFRPVRSRFGLCMEGRGLASGAGAFFFCSGVAVTAVVVVWSARGRSRNVFPLAGLKASGEVSHSCTYHNTPN